MAENRNNKSSYVHRKVLPKYLKKSAGGTIINIIVALIFFGLIAMAVMWVFKTAGDMGGQYTDAMVDTKLKAVDVKCQLNFRSIWQSIQVYVISNSEFPESQEALERECGGSQLFQCPDPNGPKYVYIPGQRSGMPGQNILLYEPKAVHSGRCHVLLLSGQIASLTPEELQAALAQTKAGLRR
ncbi:MAG: hypothetical protein JW715_06980 [Sedimentisphaerales bacterium]|nr:hypothetical protein [Sedimentisphaerales bacterium]